MKIAMFETVDGYVKWLNREISRLSDALRIEEQNRKNAESGMGRKEFLEWNHIEEGEIADIEWNKHIEWLKGYERSLKRRIRKHQKEIKKVTM